MKQPELKLSSMLDGIIKLLAVVPGQQHLRAEQLAMKMVNEAGDDESLLTFALALAITLQSILRAVEGQRPPEKKQAVQ